MPNENADNKAILYAVREIQNDLTLQTAKPLNLNLMFIVVVSQPASGYHTTQAEPHRNTNTHRTRAIQHMK
jgi:hypothetical protein